MKKRLAIILASVAILAIGAVGVTFAQTPTPPSQGGCGGFAGGQGSYDPAANPVVKRLADKIDIEAADLVAQVKGGKSLAEVAKSKGVDEQALVDVVQAPMVEMMQVMAKYGYADQDQIDSMLKYMSDYTKNSLEQPGILGSGMMGGGMMSGGMMGGFGGGRGMMGGWQPRTN